MKLFEYAAFLSKSRTLIIPPTCIVAKDENEAKIIAARAIPEQYIEKLTEVELAIRPF